MANRWTKLKAANDVVVPDAKIGMERFNAGLRCVLSVPKPKPKKKHAKPKP
ncbi:MAG TPA: hypothetical protein VKJ65_13070 [Phycisphaerae bacterium]|nr:hypothetical protein [Phycisphaerae bacterium]